MCFTVPEELEVAEPADVAEVSEAVSSEAVELMVSEESKASLEASVIYESRFAIDPWGVFENRCSLSSDPVFVSFDVAEWVPDVLPVCVAGTA